MYKMSPSSLTGSHHRVHALRLQRLLWLTPVTLLYSGLWTLLVPTYWATPFWSSSPQEWCSEKRPRGNVGSRGEGFPIAEICKNKTIRPLGYIHSFRASGCGMQGMGTVVTQCLSQSVSRSLHFLSSDMEGNLGPVFCPLAYAYRTLRCL